MKQQEMFLALGNIGVIVTDSIVHHIINTLNFLRELCEDKKWGNVRGRIYQTVAGASLFSLLQFIPLSKLNGQQVVYVEGG